MSTAIFALGIIAAFIAFLWLAQVFDDSGSDLGRNICYIAAIAIPMFLIDRCTDSPEWRAKQQAEAAAEAARMQPRLIRQADGCNVYAFWADGREHYFTKCPNGQTTTESSYTVKSGKTSAVKTETITTDSK